MTDSILRTIESSKQKELEPSRAIIKSIRQRKLYKFADEVLVPPEKWDHILPKVNDPRKASYSNKIFRSKKQTSYHTLMT